MPSWAAAFWALFIKRRTYWEQPLICHGLTLSRNCQNTSASVLFNGPNSVKIGALVTTRAGPQEGTGIFGRNPIKTQRGGEEPQFLCGQAMSKWSCQQFCACPHLWHFIIQAGLSFIPFGWSPFTEGPLPSENENFQPLHAPRAALKPRDLTPKSSVGTDGSPPVPNDANPHQSLEKRSKDFVPRQGGNPHIGRFFGWF